MIQVAKLNQQYQSLILQIKQDADNFADYITYAADGLLKVTPSQKSNILSGLNNKLTAMAKDMGSTEVNQVTDILKKNYTDTYYKNAYIMDSGLNINLKFDI